MSHESAHSREQQPQRNLHNSQGFPQNAKCCKYSCKYTSCLSFCSTDLGHIFGNNVGNEFGIMMIRKKPHEPEYDYDLVHIHSLMIYSDLVEYNNVPLLRCFPFISKKNRRDFIITGQYTRTIKHSVTYRLDPCSKNFFIVYKLI